MISKSKLENYLPNKDIRISKEYLDKLNDEIKKIIVEKLNNSYKYAKYNGRITLKKEDLK